MRLGVLLAVLAVPLAATACVSRSSDEKAPELRSDEENVQVFDESALEGEDGIKRVLVEDYLMANVDSVDCPADQEVKQGSEFECTVEAGGDELTVTITVTDEENAEYQVGVPG